MRVVLVIVLLFCQVSTAQPSSEFLDCAYLLPALDLQRAGGLDPVRANIMQLAVRGSLFVGNGGHHLLVVRDPEEGGHRLALEYLRRLQQDRRVSPGVAFPVRLEQPSPLIPTVGAFGAFGAILATYLFVMSDASYMALPFVAALVGAASWICRNAAETCGSSWDHKIAQLNEGSIDDRIQMARNLAYEVPGPSLTIVALKAPLTDTQRLHLRMQGYQEEEARLGTVRLLNAPLPNQPYRALRRGPYGPAEAN